MIARHDQAGNAQPCQFCRNLDVLVRAAFVDEVPGHDDDIRARVKAVQMIDDKPQLDIGLRHAAVGLTSGPDVQVGELGDQHVFAKGDAASRTSPRGRLADEGLAGRYWLRRSCGDPCQPSVADSAVRRSLWRVSIFIGQVARTWP